MKKFYFCALIITLLFVANGCNAYNNSLDIEEYEGLDFTVSSPPQADEDSITIITDSLDTDEDLSSEEILVIDLEETDPYGNKISEFSEKTRFPLYAMIKEEDIYLYGISNSSTGYGMILYQDIVGTYFDWIDFAWRGSFPHLSYFDYDNDGEKELAVIIHSGRGTAYLENDLHILKPQFNDEYGYVTGYEEYSLLGKDIENLFTKDYSAKYSDDKMSIIFTLDSESHIIELDDNHYSKWGEILSLFIWWGEIFVVFSWRSSVLHWLQKQKKNLMGVSQKFFFYLFQKNINNLIKNNTFALYIFSKVLDDYDNCKKN